MVGIPKATLHGLGWVATGMGSVGLGATKAENAIIQLLRMKGVANLSEVSLKKAFARTFAPGLCLALAQSLIRRGELSMATLGAALKKKPAHESGLSGLSAAGHQAREEAGRITDLDILEMRLQKHKPRTAGRGLGNVDKSVAPAKSDKADQNARDEAVPSGQIMSASALKAMKFPTIGLTGKWKELIGDPAPGFSAMVYGLPKQGKSTFCLQLANDLAKLGPVLYCALEEGFGATFSEKLHRLGITATGLQFANHLPENFCTYKFVFIDSISEASLDAESLRDLRKANPRTAFIFVYHSTKAGNFRGNNTDAHDVDIIVEVRNCIASAKGRYGPPEEITL